MILKNTTITDIEIKGRVIPASGQIAVDIGNQGAFASSDDLITKIASGDVVVNDGTSDLGVSDGINLLKGFYQKITTDSEGSPIQRIKTTQAGWHYQPHWLEINTSDYDNGFYNKDVNGNDLGFATYKIYDDTDTEITSTANEGNAVKTVVTWEPTHDYEIIATKVFQATSPASDVRMWVEGLPDVPYASGGSRFFAQGGINLKMLDTGSAADTDGRSSKFLSYNATYHTNKFEITLKHSAGLQHTVALMWEIYKA